MKVSYTPFAYAFRLMELGLVDSWLKACIIGAKVGKW